MNELAKSWHFYSQPYYRHDLDRVCEAEEVVNEWFDLPAEIEARQGRHEVLVTYGFPDMVE